MILDIEYKDKLETFYISNLLNSLLSYYDLFLVLYDYNYEMLMKLALISLPFTSNYRFFNLQIFLASSMS